MKRNNRVTKAPERVRSKKGSAQGIRGSDSRPSSKRSYGTIEDVLNLYKPRKKPITLRLDADVLAWFKRQGRGYQTRINAVLRKLMRDEMKR